MANRPRKFRYPNGDFFPVGRRPLTVRHKIHFVRRLLQKIPIDERREVPVCRVRNEQRTGVDALALQPAAITGHRLASDHGIDLPDAKRAVGLKKFL